MIHNNFGEIAALITALCWTITASAFELAGKKVGSLSVNLIRLVMAFFFIGIYTWTTRGMFLPFDASSNAWVWLSISGLIGFVIGDLFLFQAYVEIGSRISMLIMSTAPPITAILGFLLMGEMLSISNIIGMIITISGIAIVILVRKSDNKKVELSHPIKGLVFAFIGAIGQSLGLIFSKIGMGNYNPFAATQIRIIAGIMGFVVFFIITKRWNNLISAVKNTHAMKFISLGSFFGPFLGVSFSLLAVQYTTTGVASTIMAIVPVLIIPSSILVFKEKVTTKEILGAIVTVSGVALLFI